MWIYVALVVLVGWCIFCTLYAINLHRKLSKEQATRHYYYETNEWFDGKTGVRYSVKDEEMDSLVYLPSKQQVCWFHGRKVADVQSNGTFVIKFDNGGRLTGTIQPKNSQIELVGLPGTSEDGVTENMVLND